MSPETRLFHSGLALAQVAFRAFAREQVVADEFEGRYASRPGVGPVMRCMADGGTPK